MGAIQAKFSKESSKDSSLPTDFGDDSLPTNSGQNDLLNSQSQSISMEKYYQNKTKLSIFEVYSLYRFRIPYLIEDTFGINMNYYTSMQIPSNLIT